MSVNMLALFVANRYYRDITSPHSMISVPADITDTNAVNLATKNLQDDREYPIRKALSDQHAVGCHCKLCDWVDDYEYFHGMSEPEQKCHCVDHCVC